MEMLNLKNKLICKVSNLQCLPEVFLKKKTFTWISNQVEMYLLLLLLWASQVNLFKKKIVSISHLSHQLKSTWSRHKNFLYFPPTPPKMLPSPAPFFWCNARKKCALKTGRRKRAGKAKDEEKPRKEKQVCDPHRAKTDDGNQSLPIRVEVEWRDKGGEFVVVVGGVCGGGEKEPAQQYGSIALGK